MAPLTDPPGLPRLRVVLLMFVLYAGTGVGGHAPAWTRLVLMATAVAIPVAIAIQHGRPGMRALLGISSRLRLRGGPGPAPEPIQPE
ncbi:hypothetical protein AB0B69_16375 [Micromonospora parva]|uniref:hypothetical protein n=1 Tax=Micromonospora TaxID=1873 RepID=UPI0024A0503D|nr:hypothetical protein [Micromonospora sp. NBRC 107095]GLZ60564.1 hypothetical protein Misp05_41400 [Micromonospora sp. NBRC 107095]